MNNYNALKYIMLIVWAIAFGLNTGLFAIEVSKGIRRPNSKKYKPYLLKMLLLLALLYAFIVIIPALGDVSTH